jgi:hypothetical protein
MRAWLLKHSQEVPERFRSLSLFADFHIFLTLVTMQMMACAFMQHTAIETMTARSCKTQMLFNNRVVSTKAVAVAM